MIWRVIWSFIRRYKWWLLALLVILAIGVAIGYRIAALAGLAALTGLITKQQIAMDRLGKQQAKHEHEEAEARKEHEERLKNLHALAEREAQDLTDHPDKLVDEVNDILEGRDDGNTKD